MSNVGSALDILAGQGTVAAVVQRDAVAVSGADAVDYLQGQLSQDVAGLEVGATSWSFLLQPQGKVDAWFRMTRVADDRFVLDLAHGYGNLVVERLNRFKLRVDVDVASSETLMIGLRGPASPDEARQLAEQLNALDLPAGWNGATERDVLLVDGQGEAKTGVDLTNLDLGVAHRVDSEFLEWDRIHRGVPAMGSELDDSTIPAAAAVVDVSTDFTKGCYVGQELVARVDSRGSNTPTKLVRLSAETSDVVAPGSSLQVDGVDAGRVTSAVSSGRRLQALAYLKRSVVDGTDVWPITGSVEASGAQPLTVSIDLVTHPA